MRLNLLLQFTVVWYIQVFLRRFRDPICGSLELKIGSLESEKIIIGSLQSEKIGP